METNALQTTAQTSLYSGKSLPVAPKGASLNKIRDTAQQFEAVFISQMIKPMFEGINSDSMFGGGAAEDMYRSLMIDEYGKSIAKSGGIGIADSVLKEMLKLQEAK